MNDVHDAARTYHRRGLPITLCRGKVPIDANWQMKRWTLGEIAAAFRADPELNVGICLGPASGLIDLEADGPLADQTLLDMFEGDVPVTPTFASRRGYHRLFGWHRELEQLGKSTVQIGDLEVRIGANGKGTQSLMPPSTADNFTRVSHVSLEECEPAPLPERVLQRLLDEFGPRASGPTMSQRAQRGPKDLSSVLSVHSVLSVTREDDVATAIRESLPSGPGRRHRQIFQFARRLKSMPSFADADLASLRPIVKQWHAAALPYIRTTPFEETWIDFVEGWEKVKFPIGQEPIVHIYQQALLRPWPDCATQYEQPLLRSLVALCQELQDVSAGKPFFLAGRTAAQLIGVEHRQAARWLRLLVADEILQIADVGKRGHATRYRYCGD